MNRLLEYYSKDLYLRIENILLNIFHYIFYQITIKYSKYDKKNMSRDN